MTAVEMEYTYNVNNDDPMVYGFNKKETYLLAITTKFLLFY